VVCDGATGRVAQEEDRAVSEQQRPDDAPHTEPTGQQPAVSHEPPAAPTPPAGPDRAATAPQPMGWPSAPWSGAPTSAPSYGTPHTGSPHTGTPYPGPPYGPVYGAAPQAGAATAYAPATPAPRRGGRWRLGVAGLVAGALIGGGAGAGAAVLLDDDGPATASPTSGQQVVINDPQTATTATAAAAKAAPSVVTIYVSGSSGSGSGSGVVLTEDGYVLTNNHVVAEAGSGSAVQVRTADGTLYDAEIVGTDPSADVAVVRLDGASGLTPATFADSDDVQVGDVAVAIGAPLGLSNTVTDGIISATNRAVNLGSSGDENTVIDAIQTDAAINPGNSGGALVDGAGEVIGINTAIASVAGSAPGSDQSGNIGVGFAIPSNTAKRIATELIEDGEAQRALLGVSATTEAENSSAVGAGARVVRVQTGSPAADAGLQAGDVVTAIEDRPVTSSTELTAAVRSRQPGDEVSLTVQRDGDTQTVQVTLGATS
jgi:S1-C subfamily serine protease